MKQELFEITTETQKTDRYFWGRRDNRPTLYALHADHSITIASDPQVGLIESLDDVRDQRWVDYDECHGQHGLSEFSHN